MELSLLLKMSSSNAIVEPSWTNNHQNANNVQCFLEMVFSFLHSIRIVYFTVSFILFIEKDRELAFGYFIKFLCTINELQSTRFFFRLYRRREMGKVEAIKWRKTFPISLECNCHVLLTPRTNGSFSRALFLSLYNSLTIERFMFAARKIVSSLLCNLY